MCGITGIIDPKMAGKDHLIKKMTSLIAHRGPDDDGFYADDYVALGMRRLSIIDLAHGKQPIVSEDGRYLIFFNGEIYNYKELKKELEAAGKTFQTESDTEVILMMYLTYGPKMLPRLRGMFAFAIYDTEEKKVFLARDFFGIKPLYYLTKGDKIVAFSSEIKSFFALPSFKAEVNDEAVYNYLSFQYNPLEETFFKNVFKLPPAHYLTVDLSTGKTEQRRYWQFEFKPNEKLNEEETRQQIAETIEDSVKHHMIADVPVGSFLSGGIDSSIITTLMGHLETGFPSGKKVKTFTVTFDEVSEGVEARETAEPLGTDHTEISVGAEEYFAALPEAIRHFDEPVADPSALGLYFLAKAARHEVKVVLSGEGADELFGGYNIYLEPFARRKIMWMPQFVLKLIARMPFRGRNYAERALSKMEDWYIGNASIFKREEVRALWRGAPQEEYSLDYFYSQVEDESDSTKMQYIDLNTWLVGDILAKADKMTMAHSLELRVPFLDIEVAKLAQTLPDKFKWKGGVTKYLLREAFRSVLPESTRNRKKLGFPTPVRNWFNAERKDLYNLILSNVYIKSHFNVKEIERLIRAHVSRKEDNSRKIYLLLSLAIWYNVFFGEFTISNSQFPMKGSISNENSKLKIEN